MRQVWTTVLQSKTLLAVSRKTLASSFGFLGVLFLEVKNLDLEGFDQIFYSMTDPTS